MMLKRSAGMLIAALVCASTMAAIHSQDKDKGSGTIAGRVVDSTGAPIPAARVMLLTGPGPERRVMNEHASDRTLADDAGRFVFNAVPAGTYRIEASKPGWLAGAFGRKRPGGAGTTFDLADGARRNDFVIPLWRAAVIGGRVVDDTGDPVIGAEVRAVKQVFIAGRKQNDEPVRARTDDQGIYRFSGLLPGDYVIAVLASVLSEPPGFAGAVRASQETPHAYLQTMTSTGAVPMLFERATGLVGSGRALVGSLSPLPGLPPGDAAWPTYPTTFHPSVALQSAASVIRVVAGDVRTDVAITVRLTPTFVVSGVVRDADGAAAWHAVHLVAAETGDRPLVDVATAITDAKGAFTLYGVPPGRYIARVIRVPWPSGASFGICGGTGAIPQVCAFRDGPSTGGPSMGAADVLWHVSEPVVVSDRAVRDLTLTMREGARVRGRARFEGARAQPGVEEWRGAEVSLMPANGRSDTGNWASPFANDGRFVSSSVWPGAYLISARAPEGWHFKDASYQGRDHSVRPINLTADLDNVIVTFTDQVRTIKGAVTVEPGTSADDATVVLFPADQTLWVDYGRASRVFGSARVSAAGQFSLALPPAGDYFLVAVSEESLNEWQNPAVLAKLASLAERIHVIGDASLTEPLQLKRMR
jgi:protocatechuate 3,4-dioxygenase beta subunit